MAETAAYTDYKALYEQSQLQIAQLRHELGQLKKMIFGVRQERFMPDQSTDAAQLSMGLSAEPVAATSLIKTQKIEYKRTTSRIINPVITHQGRMKLPDHLERKEILVDVEGMAGCRRIGEEVTEELEYEPGRLYVNRYVRPEYVSADNPKIVIAPLPERPLPKAIAGPGLLTQILIDKYVDHLPLHRQQQRFSREKINIPYSTITDWVSNSCKLITLRRKFVEARLNDQARADYVLEQIQELYAIERKADQEKLPAYEVLTLRRDKAVPILEALNKWMQQAYTEVLPQSTIGKALAYSITRWEKLMIYTSDGKLHIDNNPVENAIRPVAIGRKNYLFAGSHEAAQRSAMLYSLIGTCKLHDINPFEWMKSVLEKISVHPINKIGELLPHAWDKVTASKMQSYERLEKKSY